MLILWPTWSNLNRTKTPHSTQPFHEWLFRQWTPLLCYSWGALTLREVWLSQEMIKLFSRAEISGLGFFIGCKVFALLICGHHSISPAARLCCLTGTQMNNAFIWLWREQIVHPLPGPTLHCTSLITNEGDMRGSLHPGLISASSLPSVSMSQRSNQSKLTWLRKYEINPPNPWVFFIFYCNF